VKGDKIVAFCDRRRNVIAPFVTAPGNRNELPLLREALPDVMRIVRDGIAAWARVATGRPAIGSPGRASKEVFPQFNGCAVTQAVCGHAIKARIEAEEATNANRVHLKPFGVPFAFTPLSRLEKCAETSTSTRPFR
jgi:hypothetical protein